MHYLITGISLDLRDGEDQIKAAAAKRLKLEFTFWTAFRIVRKSLDARRNRPPRLVYTVEIEVSDATPVTPGTVEGVTVAAAPLPVKPSVWVCTRKPELRPVVVGSGPAGLFAALTLAMQGVPVLLLERGGEVASRVKAVNRFWEEGILDPTNNVQFGEGGAGTFSDGKLTSRAKNPMADWVKSVLVEMGAPVAILTDAKPHIGTDNLRRVVVNLRKKLINLGCEIRFQAKMTGLLLWQGKLQGIVVNDTEEISTRHLILAIGQSADDTYRLLLENDIVLEPKPFAMGLRVEHPQELINKIQYGPWWTDPLLPPAEYALTAQVPVADRGVYTFCMCPGGRVIGSSADHGRIVTNGMSDALRDGPFANSAVVVTIRAEDFATEENDPLAGLTFRKRWEVAAFTCGGGDYHAPAQGLPDFLAGREGPLPQTTSFRPGVRPAALRDVLPTFVAATMQAGFRLFERKMPGFICREAVLIGVETRTSSPVRIKRGEDGQCVDVQGIYPCGEGAGYAGGIISSALDGIAAAKCLLK
jgi:uncharacterized FAD-dependent dehydrogenase